MFGQIIEILDSSSLVVEYEISQLVEERSASFFKAKVILVDGSLLFIKELRFPDGSKYSYHWQDIDGQLLIRWDNAPHHEEIDTYPNHKHVGEEIVSSSRVSVEEVLSEITTEIEKHSNEDTEE